MDIRPILLSLKRSKFMAIVMLVQVAITMAVLSNSIFIAKQTLKEWNLPSGIPHEDVIRISARFYDESRDVGQALSADLERVSNFPSVVSVTPSNAVPFTAENVINVFLDSSEEAQPQRAVVFEADENIFDVLDLTISEGRKFNASEVIKGESSQTSENAPVVLISEAMAELLFAEESPIGKTVWLTKGGDPVQVIGVYNNFMTGERLNGRGQSYQSFIRPQVKWAIGQEPHYLIRMEKGIAEQSIEDVLALFYKEQGRIVATSELLKRTQKRMYDGRGSTALTFLVISIILVIITALGITGFTSFQVTQRKKQIGTRRALGAKKIDIIRYFLTENSVVTLMGLLIGCIITMAIAFFIAEQSGQQMLDVGVLLLVALSLWLINLIAVFIPAKRAANIAPAIVTRSA